MPEFDLRAMGKHCYLLNNEIPTSALMREAMSLVPKCAFLLNPLKEWLERCSELAVLVECPVLLIGQIR